jgi:TPR repeat protein
MAVRVSGLRGLLGAWLPGLLALAVVTALTAADSRAAPAMGAAQQAEVDRAVSAYRRGRQQAARAAFEALAQRHVPAGEFNLAMMHLRGEVPAPDRGRARLLLESAGRAGFVTAQWTLGCTLESGELGRKDLVQAHDWYALAAEAGQADAQLAMGTAYYLGRGRPKQPASAAHWFRLAALQGDVGAMYLLASMYEQGDGLDLDLRLARYWYAAAAQAGDLAAPGKLKDLDARAAAQPD